MRKLHVQEAGPLFHEFFFLTKKLLRLWGCVI